MFFKPKFRLVNKSVNLPLGMVQEMQPQRSQQDAGFGAEGGGWPLEAGETNRLFSVGPRNGGTRPH